MLGLAEWMGTDWISWTSTACWAATGQVLCNVVRKDQGNDTAVDRRLISERFHGRNCHSRGRTQWQFELVRIRKSVSWYLVQRGNRCRAKYIHLAPDSSGKHANKPDSNPNSNPSCSGSCTSLNRSRPYHIRLLSYQ